MSHHQHADLDKHSDEELRDAVQTAQQQDERIAREGSRAALRAERTQRAAMEDELERRQED